MKKIMSTILIIAMLLALSACSTQNANTAEAETYDPVEEVQVETSEEVAQETETESVATEEVELVEEPGAVEKISIKVAAMKGPTGMGMSKLMADSDNGETANDYSFDLYSAPDELTAKLITGEYDIAAIPTNLAANLYKKTEGQIQLLALNTLGVLYIMQNSPDGETITQLSELAGKTLYATGQGSNPEYVLNYLLRQAGLEPGVDVTIEYLSAHDELVALAATGEVEYCMLPEPNVSVLSNKNADMKVAIDLTQVWEESGAEGVLTMGCLVVNSEFATENPQAVDSFLEEYAASVDYVNSNPSEAADIIVNYEIVGAAPVALKALPNCNIVCITGEDIWPAIEGYYQVLFDAEPTSVGGTMPESSMVWLG